jgi:CheY-like chemotaxis protein
MTLTHHRSDSLRGPLPDPVVHELKTAMSMIMGFAELLETRDDPETRSEAARGIVLAAARLRSTIETITGTPLDNGSSPRHLEEVTDDEPRPKHRLMVIDDDPSEVEVLRAAFPKERYEMVDVRNADEGLDALDDLKPDLIILDWKLPAGGGAETLAELKLRNPDLPVIVLDDEGDPKQRRIATLLDADEFLTRPFNAVELLGRAEDLAVA